MEYVHGTKAGVWDMAAEHYEVSGDRDSFMALAAAKGIAPHVASDAWEKVVKEEPAYV